jgi:hypothetical protein
VRCENGFCRTYPGSVTRTQHFLFLCESLWGFYGFNHAQKDNNNQQNEM